MRRMFAALFSIFGFSASAALAIGPESEGWSAFVRQHADSGASSVLVDLDLLGWMANNPHGSEITVSVDIVDPTETGLPGEAELARLHSLEDRLSGELKRTARGRLIGHIFGQGKATYHIYVDTEDQAMLRGLTDIAKELRASASARIVPVGAARIGEHVLNPTAAEYQIVKDTMVLRQLADNGDLATTPRQIEHWAYFPERASADQFAAAIGAEGMSVLSLSQPAEAAGRTQVYFSHIGSVLPDDISGITVRLDELATRLGGHYDGWATPVMRPD
jgi:Regulator of ribonuclease activity B/Family of unknown function (DUF695)